VRVSLALGHPRGVRSAGVRPIDEPHARAGRAPMLSGYLGIVGRREP
jgi:hypothetical protein